MLRVQQERGVTLAVALNLVTSDARFSRELSEGRNTIAAMKGRKSEGKGWGRDAFSRLINAEVELLSARHPDKSPREIFLLASSKVGQRDPQALKLYRQDCEVIHERV